MGRRYAGDQSRLDLIQLVLFAPFRGGIGMPWETLSPPADGTAATNAAWRHGQYPTLVYITNHNPPRPLFFKI